MFQDSIYSYRNYFRLSTRDKQSRRNGGSGLGLAIAQAIVQHHGGIITLTSQVGVGSCFTTLQNPFPYPKGIGNGSSKNNYSNINNIINRFQAVSR